MNLLAHLLGSNDVELHNDDLSRMMTRMHDRAFVAAELVKRMAVAEGLLPSSKPEQSEPEGNADG